MSVTRSKDAKYVLSLVKLKSGMDCLLLFFLTLKFQQNGPSHSPNILAPANFGGFQVIRDVLGKREGKT